MLRRDFLVLTGAGLRVAASVPTTLSPSSFLLEKIMQTSSSRFAPVNGLNLYYEIHGEGQPPLCSTAVSQPARRSVKI
jgi:hypothetical protein